MALNRILIAPENDLHIRRIMDQVQVLLVTLAKGRIGEDSSSLLGALLVTTIGLAAYSRRHAAIDVFDATIPRLWQPLPGEP